MVMRSNIVETSQQSSISSNNDSNRKIHHHHHHQTLKKFVVDQPLHSSVPRMLSHISLDEIVLEGRWKFRRNDNDQLRYKSMGVENLVYICLDIMNKTQEIIRLKQQNRQTSLSTWTLVKIDSFRTLSDADRAHLNRAHILDLMTIVFEAASTSASISQLVLIWRQASEHVNRRSQLSTSHQQQLKVSYETALKHLIHTPDNQLLHIALHASLITGHSRMALQELGEKLGIQRTMFDVGSIRDSTHAFTSFIKLLREQKLKREREQQTVDIHKLPYKPKKKRGLNANVSGTKFPVGKLLLSLFSTSVYFIEKKHQKETSKIHTLFFFDKTRKKCFLFLRTIEFDFHHRKYCVYHNRIFLVMLKDDDHLSIVDL